MSVHHEIHGAPTPSARHLQGEFSRVDSAGLSTHRIPRSGDQLRGPTPRGGADFTHDLGGGSAWMSSPNFAGSPSLSFRGTRKYSAPARDESYQAGPRHRAPWARVARPSALRGRNPFDLELLITDEYRDRALEDVHGLVLARLGVNGSSSPARTHHSTAAHCAPVCSRWVFNSALEPIVVHDGPTILRAGEDGVGQGHGGTHCSIAKALLSTLAAAGIARRHGQDRHGLASSVRPHNRA
jgi:hypothetical protein